MERRRRAGIAATLAAVTIAGGLTAPARRADASISQATWQVPALEDALMSTPAPGVRGVQSKRFIQRGPGIDADPDELITTLRLTRQESQLLRAMLHEAVVNDLDLIEDTLYQAGLVDPEAVARVALAVRLDVAME